MSGGKGGGQSTKTEIPAWAEAATKRNLARAEEVQKIGYMPYYGPDVAGFTPTQQAAMQNNLAAASAFGMAAPTDAMAGMPQAQDFGGGISGYSSGNLFDQAVAEFERKKPAYAKEYNELFAGGSTNNFNPYPSYPGSDRLGSIPVDYNPYAGSRSTPPMPDTRGGNIEVAGQDFSSRNDDIDPYNYGSQEQVFPEEFQASAASQIMSDPVLTTAAPQAVAQQMQQTPQMQQMQQLQQMQQAQQLQQMQQAQQLQQMQQLQPVQQMQQLQQLNIPAASGNQLSLPAAPKKGIDQMMFDMRNVGRIS